MQLSLDALLLGPHAGNSGYSINNYFNFCRQHLPESMPDWCIGCLSPGGTPTSEHPSLSHRVRHRAWWDTYIEWPLRLRRQRAELFHVIDQGLAWYAKFIPRARCITTVHDLIAYLTSSGGLTFDHLPYRRKLLVLECVRQIRRMDHIIAVSQHTANCLVRELAIPVSRITVVHNPVDKRFTPLAPFEY